MVRVTASSRAILAELEAASGFRSVADIHLALRAGGRRVGLSTVYRRLHDLALEDRVETVRGASGERLFRRCRASRHTHVLLCRSCGRDVEIDDAALEARLTDLGRTLGFEDLHHELTLSGVCAGCTRAVRADARLGVGWPTGI